MKEAPAAFKLQLALILGLAFLLRLWGAGFGLPHIYHQDEPIIVNHALAIGAGGWNTHFFVIPPFITYYLFFLYAIFYAIGRALSWFADPSAFAVLFLKDPTVFYWIGRVGVGVLPGTLTVWVLARGVRRFFAERTALLAAFFLAVSPMHVQHSHYIYADVPVTLVCTLLLFLLFELLERPVLKTYLFAGAVLGWAAATKYTAAYILPACLAAHFFASKKIPAPKQMFFLFSAVGAGAAAFFIIAPFNILDWASFYSTIHRQSGSELFVGWGHHLFYSLAEGGSVFLVVLALAGLFLLTRSSGKIKWVLFFYLASYYTANTFFSQHFDRYMLVAVPPLCFLAAYACQETASYLSPLRQKLLLGLMILPLLAGCFLVDSFFVRKDTRDACLAWVHSHIRPGTAIALENKYFSPDLSADQKTLRSRAGSLVEGGVADAVRAKRQQLEIWALESAAKEGSSQVYSIYTFSNPDWGPNAPHFSALKPFVGQDAESLKKEGIRFVIVNYTDELPGLKKTLAEHPDRFILRASFSPFKDPKQKKPLDWIATTAGPHTLKDFLSRKISGPYLEIYEVTA